MLNVLKSFRERPNSFSHALYVLILQYAIWLLAAELLMVNDILFSASRKMHRLMNCKFHLTFTMSQLRSVCPSFFCKSFPLQPFFFFIRTDYTIPQTFTVTHTHARTHACARARARI